MSTKLSLKAVNAAKKITSPLAKYNSIGQLFCVLCNTQIKNEMYWTGHINGKAHRDQVQLVKNKGQPPPPPTSQKRPASTSDNGNKNNGISSNSSSEALAKKLKLDGDMMAPPMSSLVLKTFKPPTPKKKTFQEIEAEEAAMDVDSSSMVLISRGANDEDDDDDEKEASVESSAAGSSSASLPAGFFDDAKEDAKARGIEYKNPEEAEWDKFVKEIASEDVKSSVLRTADEEYSAKDRELDEIEEQMKNWQRVLQLEKKADEARKQLSNKKNNPTKQDEDDSMDEEENLEDYDEDLDWRTKKY